MADDNVRVRDAWNANARFWDTQMAEGNNSFRTLIWPSAEKLLQIRPGETVLDVACGNGLTSRRLASAGAQVVAFDFSEELIRIARERGGDIDYRIVDATDAEALRALGPGRFDAALCNMAIMDMAEIGPLMRTLPSLLRPNGRFVFSILHPCFNNPSVVQMAERQDRGSELVTTHSVKISRYMTPYTQAGVAMNDQPAPHPFFHRTLTTLLGEAFDAGFVVDAIEEPAFPAQHAGGAASPSWSGHFSEIPPFLVARLRPHQARRRS